MLRTLSLRLAAILATACLVVAPSTAWAQKALVYCPVGVDATGCNAITAALAAEAASFPGGVDAGYDGTSGTVDLATADLASYAVLVIPSLADGQGVTPYALLRDGTIAGRIGAAFVGRTAVWSGTPDVGSTNRTAKDELIRNLARWAKSDAAGTHGPGLVVLQDNSDDVAGRYGWLAGISAVSVGADPTLELYSNVEVTTSAGRAILTNGSGLQIGYTNMASFGLTSLGTLTADATGGRSGRPVLATAAGEPSNSTIATVRTDKEDYAPGDTVIVTGTGWAPGETVSMVLHEDPLVHGDRTLSAVADEAGHIYDDHFSPEEHDVGVRFTLVATGQTSGATAQTTFTDANREYTAVVSPTTQTGCVAGNLSFTITNTGGSPNTDPMGAMNLTVPLGYTALTAGVPTASAGKTWTATIVSGQVQLRATSDANRILPPNPPTIPNPGQQVSVVVTATPPLSSTPRVWTTEGRVSITGTGAQFNIVGAEPTVTISTGVNTAPSFTKGTNQTVLEDAGTQNVSNWATAISAGPACESGQTVTFNVTNDNNALFQTQPTVGSNGTLTFRPAANANGSATVTVTAQDDGGTANGGQNTSAPQQFTITVTPVNDAPSFTKGADQTVNEDAGAQSVTSWATAISAGPANESGQTVSFEITNNTNTALFSTQPAVSSTGALTYTPASDAFGSATVTLRVKDDGGTANGGVDVSATQSFLITVNAVNDVPSFTKGPDQNVTEGSGAHSVTGWATNISAGPANESGQTLTFQVTNNTNAVLFSVGPAVAANGTLSYTLAASGSGSATITLRLQDNGGTANGGQNTSATQTFVITVTSANAAPVAVNDQPYSVNEDNTLTVLAAQGVLANDTDADNDPLTAVLVTGPAAAATNSFTLNSDGSFSFEPAPDFNGPVSFTYRANDGKVNSAAAATVSITVDPVNDAPTFTKGADETVLEDAGLQTVPSWATAISAGPANESGQTLAFTLTNDNNALFAVQPALSASGTLTYTPAADAFGVANVTVKLKDNGGTANGGVDESTQSFSITITPVNDAPSFTKGPDQTVNEDAGAQSVTGWATAISAGPGESGQVLSFQVTGNTNASLFAAGPAVSASGTLTYTPAADANGEATITLRLKDDGGTANGGVDLSAAQTFKITVNAVNDAPTFTKGGDQTVLEDAGAQTEANWASNFSAGPPDEAGQVLSIATTNDNNALFAVQPSVALNGTLTYTPASNAFGSATVSVKLSDNGGTANGGVDFSTQTFTITVTPVNDAPSFTKGADQTVNEDAGAQTVTGWATAITAGPNEDGTQTVTFDVSSSNAALFSSGPAVASNGTLTYTPAANANGSATITVVAKDDGGTANGGVDHSAAQTFTITVRPVNDAPSFAKGDDVTINESGDTYTATGWATAISKGPPDENGQTLQFVVTANAALFVTYPAIDPATGTLTFRAKSTPNTPPISVSVALKDNGGTAYGGVDQSAVQTFTITVNNVNPSALSAALPAGPVPISNAAGVTVGFTDPGLEDKHTVKVKWGDGAETMQTLTVGARSNQQSHTYSQPNVYTVTVTVDDGDGGSISDTFEYIVIYDPDGGFVTGGGTIYSPAGAYRRGETLEGRANFGFVSKYLKNASVPTGNTEFQFQAGDLNFKSTTYEWLVVSGTKGQYRGYGTINGSGNYRFVLTVNDGTPDQFRIRIWSDVQSDDGTGSIVYDNQLADPTDAYANAKAAIATGSIVVHAPNGKVASK